MAENLSGPDLPRNNSGRTPYEVPKFFGTAKRMGEQRRRSRSSDIPDSLLRPTWRQRRQSRTLRIARIGRRNAAVVPEP